MTEAFSDDGQRKPRRVGSAANMEIGAILHGAQNEGEIDTGISVTAARSVAAREPQHGHD